MSEPPPAPLRSNRDFVLLWVGDTLSEVGSQATTVAMPLLVLFLTGSAAKAGIVGFARSIAYPLSPLPAGVIADRFDRRTLLIVSALLRAAALGSVAVVVALGRPPLWQLALVAFLNAALWTLSMIAERGLLTDVVAAASLSDAIAANEAREAAATIGGPPLGGFLFGLGRMLPFAADAGSFLLAGAAAFGVRFRDGRRRSEAPSAPLRSMLEGAAWLWRRPFLRDGALTYAGANVTLGSVELLGILIARHHGASSGAVGVAIALIGVGGIAGAGLSRPLRARLSPRVAVLAETWVAAAVVPLLLLCRSALAVGAVLAVFVLPIALSSSVVVGARLAQAPPHLVGRVQAASSLISASISWIGPLGVGFLFQDAGEAAAVLALGGWSLLVAVFAAASRGLRAGPDPSQARLELSSGAGT